MSRSARLSTALTVAAIAAGVGALPAAAGAIEPPQVRSPAPDGEAALDEPAERPDEVARDSGDHPRA